MGNDEIAHFKESLRAEMSDDMKDSEADVEVTAILDKKIVTNRSGSEQAYFLLEWEDKDIQPLLEILNNLHSGNVL